MYKLYPILFILISLISCDEDKEKNMSANKTSDSVQIAAKPDPILYGDEKTFEIPVTISPYTQSEFEKLPLTKEQRICDPQQDTNCYRLILQHKLDKDSGLVRQTDSTIVLKLGNGDSLQLVSKLSEADDYYKYSYDGQLDTCGYYGVEIFYYEGYGYLIVNKLTGAKLEVWSKPVVSADCKLAIVPSFDMYAGFDSNGLQLLTLHDNDVKLVWEKEIGDWGPKEVRWISDKEIGIKQAIPFLEENREEIKYARMKLIL